MTSIIAIFLFNRAYGGSELNSRIDVENGAVLDLTETGSLKMTPMSVINVAGTLKLKEEGNNITGSFLNGNIKILEDLAQDDNLKENFSEIINEDTTAYSITQATIEGNAEELGDIIAYPEMDLGDDKYVDILSNDTNFINLVSEQADKKISFTVPAPGEDSVIFTLNASLGSLGSDSETKYPVNIEINGALTFNSNVDNYDGTLICTKNTADGRNDLVVFSKYEILPNIDGGYSLFSKTHQIPSGRSVRTRIMSTTSSSVLTIKKGGILKLL